MGFRIVWLGVKGKTADQVREVLGLAPTGATDEMFEAPITDITLPNAWHVTIVDCSSEFLDSIIDVNLHRRASRGSVLVFVYINETTMMTLVECWMDGKESWQITHDSAKGLRHLDVSGELPANFPAIRDRYFKMQDDQGGNAPMVDYISDIPVELARDIVGFQHDLVAYSSGTYNILTVKPKKKSWLQKLFAPVW